MKNILIQMELVAMTYNLGSSKGRNDPGIEISDHVYFYEKAINYSGDVFKK